MILHKCYCEHVFDAIASKDEASASNGGELGLKRHDDQLILASGAHSKRIGTYAVAHIVKHAIPGGLETRKGLGDGDREHTIAHACLCFKQRKWLRLDITGKIDKLDVHFLYCSQEAWRT